ncbi:MAG: type II toxin-antitoxin system PemK/MazF family toxin [Bacillota bacterium]
MLKQGDIIKLNFNPQRGHEQSGYRPALVVSNNFFNQKCNLTIVCPITNTDREFPLHIPLDSRTTTTGYVLCEHIKSLDLKNRNYRLIEKLPPDILENVLNVIFAELKPSQR